MNEDNDLLAGRASTPSTVAAQVLPGDLDGDLDPRLLPGPALWLPRDTLADWALDPGEPPRWRGVRLVTHPQHWELVGPTDPGIAIAVTGPDTATLVRPMPGGRPGERGLRGVAMTLPDRRRDPAAARSWDRAVTAGSVLLLTTPATWDLSAPHDHVEALASGWWAAHCPVLSPPPRPRPRLGNRRRWAR